MLAPTQVNPHRAFSNENNNRSKQTIVREAEHLHLVLNRILLGATTFLPLIWFAEEVEWSRSEPGALPAAAVLHAILADDG
jgi:hypothetical protein